MMGNKIKLTYNQKKVLWLMSRGAFIFENTVTPGAKWYIGNDSNYKWGNIHGKVIKPLLSFMDKKIINIAVNKYCLNDEGKRLDFSISCEEHLLNKNHY